MIPTEAEVDQAYEKLQRVRLMCYSDPDPYHRALETWLGLAEKRARVLLESHLNPAQLADLKETRGFWFRGSNRHAFRIFPGSIDGYWPRIYWHKPRTPNGYFIGWGPHGDYPMSDCMLAAFLTITIKAGWVLNEACCISGPRLVPPDYLTKLGHKRVSS